MAVSSSKALIVGKVWPEPDSSAAGTRMLQLVDLLNEAGWEINFASASTKSDYTAHLSELGIKEVQVKLNDSQFDRYIGELKPNLVIFDRFMTEEQFGWRVAEYSPHSLRILDMEDLHFLRHARQAEVFPRNKDYQNLDLTNETAKRELAAILRSDCSLIISEYEYSLLAKQFNISEEQLFYLPFLIEEHEIHSGKKAVSFDQRVHFSWIGNFRHKPNQDAVKYLNSEIWPLIRNKLPDAEIHVYGAYLPANIQSLHNSGQGFIIKGRAVEADSVLKKSRVSLAPLRFGAGLKGKLIDSMRCGTPAVTTSIGAEGLHGEMSWPGSIEDDPVKFAGAAIELYTNRKKWAEAQSDGFSLIEKRFSKKRHSQRFLSVLKNLMQSLTQHRKKHFLASLLMHHTMAASKYMSKWIEEKNKSTET